MKSLKPLFILGALLTTHLLSAQYMLTLNLQDMDDYVGHRFEVRVTELPSGKEVGRKTIESLDSNSATLVLYVFLQGRSYNVDFYADVNDNGGYNAPPADHAWRRIIVNAVADIVLDFSPDENYMDIGFPDAFQYSQYHAVWGGKWKNLTFGSTDSIMASFELRCDSVFGMFTTKGVFGNPATVTFNYAGAVPSDTASSDTIRYSVPAPWSGEVIVVNGDISGSLSLSTATLVITGTLGEKQILCSYTVLVNGSFLANGYFYVRELNIVSSAPPITITADVGDITCFGGSDGYISVTPEGGIGGVYEYNWYELGQTTQTIYVSDPGDFIVTVFDEAGCSAEATFTVNEPEPVVTQVEITNPSCSGLCDGVIEITVIGGGGPPYIYEWSGGPGGCAGVYTVTVTDANGCTDVTTVFLTDPAPILILNLSITNATQGQNDGSITITAAGGLPPLTYSINGTAYQASNVFIGLPAGTYEVCVKDASGCIICEEVLITELVGIEDLKNTYELYPNPASDVIHLSCDIPLSAALLDFNGRILRDTDFKVEHILSIADLPNGVYTLKITDGERSSFKKIVKAKG